MADGVVSSFMNMTGAHLPRGDFFELVKAIGEAKSKQEEDRIILDEMAVLKQKMPTQATFSKKMKEYLVRLIYCEMLGHDASFGYIKAVELSASTNLLQKRVGYLAASLCFSPEHEFRFMLVNQFTRDMASINYLEVCAALGAVCRLTTTDTIPAVINDVINKLKHDQELVRKKAVMALQRFHSLQPTSITHLDDKIRRALCDKDPSVMAAVLCLLLDLIKDNPAPYKDLVPSFVSILKQITDHRLPRDYDYHRIPAPWVQIHLLRILAILGQSDQKTSEGMYEVLVDVMRRADTGINVGYAIVYECVRTVTTIYPNIVLLDAAASSIARFIGSDNHNLKYLGVKGLASIVKDHPRYAAQHQLAVIDCLEDPDETLKRKTLDLLHRMTNSVNVEFITAKLLEFLEKATDPFLRSDLVQRISQSAERYAPSNSWYIQTMTRVFLLAGELVKAEVPPTLMQLIAEGSGDDEEADVQLRRDAVETYMALLDTLVLPDVLVQTMSWVLGEYGYLSDTMTQVELIKKLSVIADRTFTDSSTRGWVISNVVKLVAQTGTCPPSVAVLLDLYSESRNLDLQQRCYEYKVLLQNPSVMVNVLPVDASCEELNVDENLSIVDAFVKDAIANGAPRYSPPVEQEDEGALEYRKDEAPTLKLTPYAKPEKPPVAAALAPTGGPRPGLPSSAIQAPMGQAPLGGLASLGTPQTLTNTNGATLGAGGTRPGFKPSTTVWTRQGAVTTASLGLAAASMASSGMSDVGSNSTKHASAEPGRQAFGAGFVDSSPTPASAKVVEKPRELTEKEKMAQALFGGMGPTGAAPPVSSLQRPGVGGRTGGNATWSKVSPGLPPSKPATPALAPPTADLLDLGFDAPAQMTPSSSQAAATMGVPNGGGGPVLDLMGTDLLAPVPGASAEQVLGTLSEAKRDTATSAHVTEDPFAALEGVVINKAPVQLPFLGNQVEGQQHGRATGFVEAGRCLQPVPMTTPEFGGKWAQMRFQAPAQVAQTTIRSLDLLGSTLSQAGLHIVQAIPRTGEVIACGSVGSDVVLVHTKLYTQRGAADCLVRCNDNGLAQSLCTYLRSALS